MKSSTGSREEERAAGELQVNVPQAQSSAPRKGTGCKEENQLPLFPSGHCILGLGLDPAGAESPAAAPQGYCQAWCMGLCFLQEGCRAGAAGVGATHGDVGRHVN